MNYKIKFSLVLLLLIFTFGISGAKDLSSPIVKVINYKSIYGKYIENLGWGSATIINNKGYIVTNNHVVEDSEGNVSDFFNICITLDENKKPDCFYTASLVERDKDLDFAVLKINSKDIYGKDVDFTSFGHLDIDFDYKIKAQDDVYAIGYPSIGAGTITKTKGIISGTTEYNGYTYIKSDTLISGGNSGGALINGNGKLIGIPTFLVGFGTNIGYSIYIKEVQDFLNEALAKNIEDEGILENFILNKTKLNSINDSLKVQDDLITFSFGKDYEVKNYIENKKIELEAKVENEYLIGEFNVGLIETPNIEEEKNYFYFLEKQGFFNKSYQKLNKKEIGGIDFFYPISIGDSTGGEGDSKILYFSKIGKNKIIYISIYRPVTEDSNKNKVVNSNLEELLSQIFISEESVELIDFSFNINFPNLNITKESNLTLSEKDGYGILYFDNLYDYFFFGLQELTIDSGRGNDIQDIYKNETIDIDDDYKTIISKDGHTGFIYCNKNDFTIKDENGFNIKQNSCVVKIYEEMNGTNDKEYYFYGYLLSNKNKIDENLTKTINFLENNLSFNKINEFDTNIINIYENLVSLNFTDIGYESDNYKNILKKLVKYKLISNSKKLNPYKSMKWKEFVLYYFRLTYNYKFEVNDNCNGEQYTCLFKNNYVSINGNDISIYDLLEEMNVPLGDYVDEAKSKIFIKHIELQLSGIDIDEYSEEWFYKYEELFNDKAFSKVKQYIDSYRNNVFGKDNVYIEELLGDEPDTFKYVKNAYFDKITNNIVFKDIYSNQKYSYSSLDVKKTSFYDNTCGAEENRCYDILTKAEMIDMLVPMIDFTLFDEQLKNRKSSIY